MQKEEIAQVLQKFGLTQYESKAYVTLALLGEAKALEISKEAGIPQSKIYSTLENLMKKQLIEILDERPKRFKVIAPSYVIKNFLKAKKEELLDLKKKAYLVGRILKPIEMDEDEIEGVWVQRSESYMENLERSVELLKKAKKSVFDVCKLSYSSSYREALLECKKRKVDVHLILTKIEKEKLLGIKWYLENDIKLKFFEIEHHPRVLVIDGKEVSIKIEHGNGFGFQSIWSKDPCFVKMVENYMKVLWEKAKDVNLKSLAELMKNN